VIAAAEAARNGINPRERKSWGVTWAVTIRMMNGIMLAGMATSRQFNYYNSVFDTRQYYNKECIESLACLCTILMQLDPAGL
jgi:hypothetical protein